jgi:LysM repeat protein
MAFLASKRVEWAAILMAVLVAGCGAAESPSSSASAVASLVPLESPSPSVMAEPSSVVAPSPSPSSALTVYVVRKGDTLIAIAKKQHVTLAALRAANPQVTDPTKLHPGDKLQIPAH